MFAFEKHYSILLKIYCSYLLTLLTKAFSNKSGSKKSGSKTIQKLVQFQNLLFLAYPLLRDLAL